MHLPHFKKIKRSKTRKSFIFRKKGEPKAPKPALSQSIKKDIFNLPNSVTMLRIVLIPAVIILLAFETPFCCLLATCFFGLAAISDFFDGYLARRLNLVSVTGKFLDPLADKLMVMAATIQLASMGWLDAWIPIVILTRELAVQGMRLIAVGEGMVIAAGSGGKIKTALQLIGLVGLLVHYSYPINLFGWETMMNYHRAGWWLIVLSVVFSLISGYQYFKAFVTALDSHEK